MAVDLEPTVTEWRLISEFAAERVRWLDDRLSRRRSDDSRNQILAVRETYARLSEKAERNRAQLVAQQVTQTHILTNQVEE